MKEVSKPQFFKSLSQIKLLRKKFMCIELKTHLLPAPRIMEKSKLRGLEKNQQNRTNSSKEVPFSSIKAVSSLRTYRATKSQIGVYVQNLRN